MNTLLFQNTTVQLQLDGNQIARRCFNLLDNLINNFPIINFHICEFNNIRRFIINVISVIKNFNFWKTNVIRF
jgi:hypothetical protein